jgi:hypothetical protein
LGDDDIDDILAEALQNNAKVVAAEIFCKGRRSAAGEEFRLGAFELRGNLSRSEK